VPDLVFFLDDSAAYAAKMDQVLSTLNIPTDEPQPDDQPDEAAPKRPRLFADEDNE
jgi:ribosome-binding factor A